MQRIKTMLMAMIAVLAVGAVGASAASAADGDGTIGIVGSGTCDVTFETDGWSPSSGTASSWSTNVSNISVDPGGTCDVSSVSGSGVLTKYANGDASLTTDTITVTVTILGFPVKCTYDGTLNGTWYWTLHDDTEMAGPPPVGSQPPGEDKYFSASGTANLISGTIPGLCPDPVDLEMTARTHEH